jgi:polyferredoxin
VWQIISTLLHNGYIPGYLGFTLYSGILKGICTPGLNCYACPGAFFACPLGALQNFVAFRTFPYFVVGLLGLVGAGVGRMTCGWICPFGLLQDGMKKISRRVVKLPPWVGYIKYVALVVLVLILPFLLMETWYCKLCPAGGVEGAIPWALGGALGADAVEGLGIGSMFWFKMAIVGFFLLTMVYIKRPFCRTFCPLGAIFSLFNKISLVKLRLDASKCTDCGRCEQFCPVDLNAYKELDSLECIKCLECTRCPTGAIKARFGLRS